MGCELQQFDREPGVRAMNPRRRQRFRWARIPSRPGGLWSTTPTTPIRSNLSVRTLRETVVGPDTQEAT